MSGNNINVGTWYQSAVSGLWYQNVKAAGKVSAVRIDGVPQHPDWYCDWCSKAMFEAEEGASDSNGHMHCSKECVEEHDANR